MPSTIHREGSTIPRSLIIANCLASYLDSVHRFLGFAMSQGKNQCRAQTITCVTTEKLIKYTKKTGQLSCLSISLITVDRSSIPGLTRIS